MRSAFISVNQICILSPVNEEEGITQRSFLFFFLESYLRCRSRFSVDNPRHPVGAERCLDSSFPTDASRDMMITNNEPWFIYTFIVRKHVIPVRVTVETGPIPGTREEREAGIHPSGHRPRVQDRTRDPGAIRQREDLLTHQEKQMR